MRKGENIYRRKDGRYEGRYPIGVSETGRKRYASVYGATKKEVREKLAIAKAKQAKKEALESADITFAEAAKRWMESQANLRATTRSAYLSIVKSHLIPYFGDYTIRQIDSKLKAEGKKAMEEKGLYSKTAGTYIRLLERIIEFNDGDEKKDINKVHEPKRKEVELLDEETWRKLRGFITSDITLTKVGIALIYFLGMKIGEVAALKWEHINIENKTLTVKSVIERVKSSSGEKASTRLAIMEIEERTIPIPKELCRMIKDYKRISRPNYFLVTGSTEAKEPRTIQYRIKQVMEEAGIEGCSTTAIRNTFAINALKKGMNPKALSVILGVNLDRIIRYIDLIEIDLKEEIQKIE